MITIDYQSKLPLYEQIAERFQTLILRGVLPPDRQMPSVRSLAVELSINPNTIQKAYSFLEQQGYIYSVKGRGNYVSDITALAEQKKKNILKEAERLLSCGKEMGVSRSEYSAVLDRLYGKEDNSDDRTEKP
ncbi:GntR family transcriptional regulator [Mediterraneibacter glycyrrhizinilyticus]|nr:GntR family transcriptional regulator [Mediterraneibacter glycyrrhizinilyticus]MBM6855009.1 GntR family transcriptional regulator [Mediterraneibacter glycyrrhizinilyticus]